MSGAMLSVAMASLAMPGRAMTVRERMPEPEPTPRRDPEVVENEIVAAANAKRLRKQARRLSQCPRQ